MTDQVRHEFFDYSKIGIANIVEKTENLDIGRRSGQTQA